MKMQEIRAVAKDMGLRAGVMKKADLIKAIQIAEGNFDCFASDLERSCDQIDCIWREDCHKLAGKQVD